MSAPSGSIPACAGEPSISARRSTHEAVYPRVCGGTISDPVLKSSGPGLSPRVRGNPFACANGAILMRSIPACAGESA